MKKLLISLFFAVVAFSATAQQFSATVTKRGSASVDTVVNYFSPDMVEYITKVGTKTTIGYTDVTNGGRTVAIVVTEAVDTLYKRINALGPHLVNVNVITKIPAVTRDTVIRWLYPVGSLSEPKTASVIALPQANAQVYRKQRNDYYKTFLQESVAQLNTRKDSVSDIATSVYDTSTYVMLQTDKYIKLNSTTADTITLKNPASYPDGRVLVIANIGSGAYTISGGFTVKDKSGSNVTSLTANTVYTFRKYYNGSSHIWLKEY